MLSEQDIAALVKDFYSSILTQDETARLMRDDPIPEERRAHYIEHYRQLAERARIDLANGAFGSVRSIVNRPAILTLDWSGTLETDSSTYHYKPRHREQADIEARIREI